MLLNITRSLRKTGDATFLCLTLIAIRNAITSTDRQVLHRAHSCSVDLTFINTVNRLFAGIGIQQEHGQQTGKKYLHPSNFGDEYTDKKYQVACRNTGCIGTLVKR